MKLIGCLLRLLLLVVLVPLLSLIPGVQPPGPRRTRWNGFVGAGLAFTGLILLTAPARQPGASLVSLLPDFSSINLGDVLTFSDRSALPCTASCSRMSRLKLAFSGWPSIH